jgi:hypothetical protein
MSRCQSLVLSQFHPSAGEMNATSEIMPNVVLERARDFLGPSCDAQLRLVNKQFYAVLASVPLEDLKTEHYLSSRVLFEWARSFLGMPLEEKTFHLAARGGHLEALQVALQHRTDWDWLSDATYLAAKFGHIHVLAWLRGLDSGFDWGADVRVTNGAAQGDQLEVLQWSRLQSPPSSFGKGCCDTAGRKNHFEVRSPMFYKYHSTYIRTMNITVHMYRYVL